MKLSQWAHSGNGPASVDPIPPQIAKLRPKGGEARPEDEAEEGGVGGLHVR